MKSYGKYIDCSGKECDIDKFHMHELLDRAHVLQDMFNSYIVDHPAATLFKEDADKIHRLMCDFYQKVGRAY